jgi:hypothetical protein
MLPLDWRIVQILPTPINFLRYKIIGGPKKLKKWHGHLFRPKINHTCHKKPNPSRETVPLTLIRMTKDEKVLAIFKGLLL